MGEVENVVTKQSQVFCFRDNELLGGGRGTWGKRGGRGGGVVNLFLLAKTYPDLSLQLILPVPCL